MTKIIYPIIYIDKLGLSIISDPRELYIKFSFEIKDKLFQNAIIVDSLLRKIIILDAKIVKRLPPWALKDFGFGYFNLGLVKVEYIFASNTLQMTLNEIKTLVINEIIIRRDYWDEILEHGELISRINNSQSFESITKSFLL